MDILGPRVYSTEDFERVTRERIEMLQQPLTAVPEPVPTAYVPSGRTESNTVPVLLAYGVGGTAAGVAIAFAIQWVAGFVMDGFIESGGCLVILLGIAIVAHFLSPLAVPLAAAGIMVLGGEAARCRSPQVAVKVGWGVGLLALAATVWFSQTVVGSVGELEAVVDGLDSTGVWGVIVGVPTVLATVFVQWKSGVFFLGVMGLLALVLVPGMADGAGSHPYCETTRSFMERRVAARYSIEQIRLLLVALHTGQEELFEALAPSPAVEDPDDKVARLDLSIASGSGRVSNLVEVTAHWFKDGKDKKESLVFSEIFGKEQVETLARVAGLSLAEGDAGSEAA